MQAALSRAKEQEQFPSQASHCPAWCRAQGAPSVCSRQQGISKSPNEEQSRVITHPGAAALPKEPWRKNTDGSTCLHPPTRVSVGCVPRAPCPAWVCCPEGFHTKASPFARACVQSRSLISVKQGQTLLKPRVEGNFECLS